MGRRSILLLALALVLAGCVSAPQPPPRPRNLTGRWIGTWSGHGVLEIPRDESAVLDLVQSGWRGDGRLTMNGTLAADSLPVAIRDVTVAGFRVVYETSGERVRLEHELGPQVFAAELIVRGDRMVGQALDVWPYLYFDLVRARPRAVAVAAAQPPPPPPPPRAVPPPEPPVPMADPYAPVVPEPPRADAPAPEPPRVAAPAPEPAPVEVPVTVRTRPPERPVDFAEVDGLRPIYFDFDSAAIRPGDAAILDANAAWLQANPEQLVLIGGYCDERGTSEYNVALGERRARAALNYLVKRGIAEDRLMITSYGFERPACADHTETCWAMNRRVLLLAKPR